MIVVWKLLFKVEPLYFARQRANKHTTNNQPPKLENPITA